MWFSWNIYQHMMTYRNGPETNARNFTMNNAIMLGRNTTNSKKRNYNTTRPIISLICCQIILPKKKKILTKDILPAIYMFRLWTVVT